MSETQTAQSINKELAKRKHALTRVYATVGSKAEVYAFWHVACGGPMWDNFGKVAPAPARVGYAHRTEDGRFKVNSTLGNFTFQEGDNAADKLTAFVARMQASQFKGTGLEVEIRSGEYRPHILTF